MSWRDVERLIGETFRRRGFTVTGFGTNGRESGVDLALKRHGERFLVRCRHWRKQRVDVTAVRELEEAIAALGADGGYLLTGGAFTPEARRLARDTQVQLIDGRSLEQLLGLAGRTGEDLEGLARAANL